MKHKSTLHNIRGGIDMNKYMYVLIKTIYNIDKTIGNIVIATSESEDSIYCEMLTESECYYEDYKVLEYNKRKIVYGDANNSKKLELVIHKTIQITW